MGWVSDRRLLDMVLYHEQNTQQYVLYSFMYWLTNYDARLNGANDAYFFPDQVRIVPTGHRLGFNRNRVWFRLGDETESTINMELMPDGSFQLRVTTERSEKLLRRIAEHDFHLIQRVPFKSSYYTWTIERVNEAAESFS